MTDKAAAAIREFAKKTFPLFGSRLDEWRKVEQDKLISDLTALISEGYYPKEFTMWCIRNVQYCRDMGNEWYQIKREGILVIKTLDEVYNYWKENER